jgi:uncharacterized protein YqeY
MSLKEEIQRDATKALKSRDTKTLSALRLLLSELHNAEIKKQEELEDEEVIQVAAKQVRKWEEAANEYERAGQTERAAKEKFEAQLLRAYLPAQMSDDEIGAAISEAIEESGACSMRDMGQVMKLVMPKVHGKADGKRVNELVKAALAAMSE